MKIWKSFSEAEMEAGTWEKNSPPWPCLTRCQAGELVLNQLQQSLRLSIDLQRMFVIRKGCL